MVIIDADAPEGNISASVIVTGELQKGPKKLSEVCLTTSGLMILFLIKSNQKGTVANSLISWCQI